MFADSDIKRLVRNHLKAAEVWGLVTSLKVVRIGFRRMGKYLVTVLVRPGCDPLRISAALETSEIYQVRVDGSYVSGYCNK